MKSLFQNALLFLFSCIVTLGIVEMGMRFFAKKGLSYLQSDSYLGWITQRNVRYELTKVDGCGQPYSLSYTTNQDGFRRFGDTASTRPKVLFIGDSFTQAIDASNDSTYFSLLGKQLSFEVFANGTGGHGTLQEAMQLEQVIGKIKPDVVVLQFCENDFINNSFDLEKASIYHNNQQRRPYLNLQGKIYYANPVQNSLARFLVNHSKLLSFLLPKIKILLEGSLSQKPANQAQHEAFNPKDYLQAEKITDLGIQKIKLICKKNNATLVSFPVDAPLLRPTQSKTPYEVLMQQNGIEILGNVPEAIAKLERAGICCRAKDEAHWNHLGHRVCAQALMNRLQFVINHAKKQ